MRGHFDLFIVRSVSHAISHATSVKEVEAGQSGGGGGGDGGGGGGG